MPRAAHRREHARLSKVAFLRQSVSAARNRSDRLGLCLLSRLASDADRDARHGAGTALGQRCGQAHPRVDHRRFVQLLQSSALPVHNESHAAVARLAAIAADHPRVQREPVKAARTSDLIARQILQSVVPILPKRRLRRQFAQAGAIGSPHRTVSSPAHAASPVGDDHRLRRSVRQQAFPQSHQAPQRRRFSATEDGIDQQWPALGSTVLERVEFARPGALRADFDRRGAGRDLCGRAPRRRFWTAAQEFAFLRDLRTSGEIEALDFSMVVQAGIFGRCRPSSSSEKSMPPTRLSST